ncbi:nucleotidyltransferase family protein [Salinisphaera japonica]|uniref:Mannose-1-phosphate guanylyltransferase n=1 Tax=Salinisphaera japonica YTM-1 TaxID=1209778 RepID=A0A423PWZ9_9GAMM|nr:mannose-1-phosphate guanylyltransferase [Salinisphaera japonica YTM-1]
MKAMILAAGRGSRLRPFTDRVPKPLVEIAGMPLIGHHLCRLAAVGIRDVVINVAYRGDQIQAALGDGQRYGVSIRYSEETPGALDTGGGIAQATSVLGTDDFLLVNADVLTDFDFRQLMSPSPGAGSGPGLTLALIDNPAHHRRGDFGLVDGRLRDIAPRLTYAGIGRFSPGLFAARAGERFALTDIIQRAIQDGHAFGVHHPGRWIDVGRAATLARARQIG